MTEKLTAPVIMIVGVLVIVGSVGTVTDVNSPIHIAIQRPLSEAAPNIVTVNAKLSRNVFPINAVVNSPTIASIDINNQVQEFANITAIAIINGKDSNGSSISSIAGTARPLCKGDGVLPKGLCTIKLNPKVDSVFAPGEAKMFFVLKQGPVDGAGMVITTFPQVPSRNIVLVDLNRAPIVKSPEPQRVVLLGKPLSFTISVEKFSGVTGYNVQLKSAKEFLVLKTFTDIPANLPDSYVRSMDTKTEWGVGFGEIVIAPLYNNIDSSVRFGKEISIPLIFVSGKAPEVTSPKNGSDIFLGDPIKVVVKQVTGASGYIYGFMQNGAMVFENGLNLKRFDGPTFTLDKSLFNNNPNWFAQSFKEGLLDVVVQAVFNSDRGTGGGTNRTDITEQQKVTVNLKKLQTPIFLTPKAEAYLPITKPVLFQIKNVAGATKYQFLAIQNNRWVTLDQNNTSRRFVINPEDFELEPGLLTVRATAVTENKQFSDTAEIKVYLSNITVLGPNGGEKWNRMLEQVIGWKGYGINGIDLWAIRDDGFKKKITKAPIIVSLNSPDGKYRWTPVNDFSGSEIAGHTFKIEAISSTPLVIRDKTDGSFIINEIASITNLSLSSKKLQLFGPPVTYKATILNRTSSAIAGVSLKAFIEQNGVRVPVGGGALSCTRTSGELPPSETLCPFELTMAAKNTSLASGVAVVVFELQQGDGGPILSRETLSITLTQ